MYCRDDNKGESDVISCMYTVYNIRENVPEPARIVIKNYNLPVQTTDSITINLAQLKTQAAVWKTQGDVLTVEKVVGFADSRPYVEHGKGTSLKLIVSGEFVNNFTHDEWVAVDENGQDYQVYINGSGSASYHHVQDDRMTLTLSGGTPEARPFALIDGLQHVPEQLTLTRKVTDKLFTGLNWSIPVPERINVE